MLTARQIIQLEYGHAPNLLTPTHIGEYLIPGGAVELSKGSGLFHDTIYGVSVVNLHADGTTSRDIVASQCFFDLAEAKAYINWLRAERAYDNAGGTI